MNTSDKNDIISDNLINFYAYFSDLSSNTNSEDVYILFNSNNFWPRFVFIRTDVEKYIEKKSLFLADYIYKRKAIMIVASDNLPNTKGFLKHHSLVPVAMWKGMQLTTSKIFSNNSPKNFTISRVKTGSELEEWTNIVNEQIFRNKIIKSSVFKNCLTSDEFKLYLGKEFNIGVSTALTYTMGNVVGLYFISTKKKAQRQGYGKFITEYAINQSIIEGNRDFVLHATKAGEQIYKKLGFLNFNKFYLLLRL